MNTKDSIIGIGLLGAGSMMLLHSLRKAGERRREEAVLRQTGNNPAVQQAQLLRQGMNPNKPLPMGWDGTDEKLILQTAAAITDMRSVQDAYRALYEGADLMKDLRSELSSKDFEQFMWQISNNARAATHVAADGSVSITQQQPATQYALGKGYKVWALKDVLLRAAPEATSVKGSVLSKIRFAWDEGSLFSSPKDNILELCKASQFIGFTTGSSRIDAAHHIPFIEVAYTINGNYKDAPAQMKKRHGEKVRGWVSASPDYTMQTLYFKEALDKGFIIPAYK